MRTYFFIGLILLATLQNAAFAQQDDAAPGQAPDDWLRLVPGDARFYVELRGLARIRDQFRELGIWETVRALHEQEADRTNDKPLQRRTQELFGLDTESVITELLGRRAALIAPDSSQWTSGVIIAELASPTDIKRLLDRWQVRTLAEEGAVQRYVTAAGLHVAALNNTVVLGPAGDPDSLWGRTVLLLAGRRGPNLAGRSEFAALRTKIADDVTGLLYGSWPKGDPSAPGECKRLLVGIRTAETQIACDLWGQRAAAGNVLPPIDPQLLAMWPADSVIVWAGSHDFSQVNPPDPGDPRGDSLGSIIRSAITSAGSGASSFAKNMGPNVAIVIAPDPAANGEFQLPAITVACDARRGEDMVRSFDGLFGILAQYLAALATPAGQSPPAVVVQKTKCEDVELHSVMVGPHLARRVKLEFLSPTEVSWTMLDGRFLLSTSRKQLERIVQASRGKLEQMGEQAGDSPPPGLGNARVTGFLHIHGSALSAMLLNWRTYLLRNHPETKEPKWWEDWARSRLAEQSRFGVALRISETTPGGAEVVDIEGFSVAVDQLLTGDVIISAGGKKLSADRPAQDVAERYQARGATTTFPLEILRDGKTIQLDIAVQPAASLDFAGLDPVGALWQIATLTRRAESITVWRFESTGDRLSGRIEINWLRKGDQKAD